MEVLARFSVVLKVSKVVKWSCIFVRSTEFSCDPYYEPTNAGSWYMGLPLLVEAVIAVQ